MRRCFFIMTSRLNPLCLPIKTRIESKTPLPLASTTLKRSFRKNPAIALDGAGETGRLIRKGYVGADNDRACRISDGAAERRRSGLRTGLEAHHEDGQQHRRKSDSPHSCLRVFANPIYGKSLSRYVSFPPMTVRRTLVFRISAGATVRMSFERTTKSASFPGVRPPRTFSSKLAY